MESLKMPMREVLKCYTKSELAILAWRSTELAQNMKHRREGAQNPLPSVPKRTTGRPEAKNGDYTEDVHTDLPGKDPGNLYENIPEHGVSDRELKFIEERFGPTVVERFVDERGEINLRKLTGDQAVHYMNVLGIPIIGMMPRRS
jgi:hypothetical protein